jgi:hypothetical protein
MANTVATALLTWKHTVVPADLCRCRNSICALRARKSWRPFSKGKAAAGDCGVPGGWRAVDSGWEQGRAQSCHRAVVAASRAWLKGEAG